jgi:hypothetical protein
VGIESHLTNESPLIYIRNEVMATRLFEVNDIDGFRPGGVIEQATHPTGESSTGKRVRPDSKADSVWLWPNGRSLLSFPRVVPQLQEEGENSEQI